MPTHNPHHMLNYSFQTGEEFAVEFMQERANLRTHFVPKNSSSNQIQPCPIMSSIAQRSQSSIPTLRMDITTQSKNIGRKTLGSVSEYEKRTSSSIQRSSRRFLPLSSNCNFTEPSIIKFLCSFGGNFLPRPSDGKIRYVGGETYILQLSKDITWKELVEKTMRLYNKAHMIKYQLPGENIHVLILVSCDEDVHHMIEECDVLQGGEEKPRLFLFSSQDEDDYSDMHFGTGSDTDCEMKFVAAINGASSTGSMGFVQDPTNMKGVASVGDLDQLIFDIDSDSTNGTNHYSGHEFTIPHKKMSFMETYSGGIKIPTKGSSNKTIPINQEYIGRYDEGGDDFLQKSNSLFGKDAGKIRMASSVPSKFKSKNISKPVYTQKELSLLDILMELKVETKETQNFENKLFSPKLKRQVSGLNYMQSIKVSSPESSNATSGDDPFFGSTSNFGYSKYEDDVNSLNYTILSEDLLVRFSRPEDEGHLIHSEGNLDGEAVLKNNAKSTKMGKDECIDLVQDTNKHFTKSFNEQRRFGSQEDEERQKGNIVRQNTIERSDPDSSIKSRKSNAIIWHDDMGISFNSGSLVRKLTKEEFSLNNFKTSQAKKNNSKTSENKKEGGSSEERRKESFEMDPVQQAYHTSAKTRPNSIRSEGGSLQIGHLSQEDRDSVKLPLFEHEEFEDEGEYEASLQKVNLLGKKFDLSNLQIISNEDLEDLRELGSGAFGTVYHGKWRGTDVAIKRIKNSCFTYQSSQTDKLVQEFWREAAILSKLHHPNVLAFYGVVKDGPGVSLATVTEFMVSGSLKRVLLRKDRYLDQRKRIMLAMDASIGMEYLHAKGVVHFDLKCDNLLVNLKDPSRPICKVGDFGLSKMKETTMVSGGMRGTLPWMAPEQLSMSSNKVSEKIDVYSFGIVMWEILTCDEPYDGMHYGQVIGGILSNTLRPPIPKLCDMDWRNLMERCWAANPNDRPSFTEIASCLRIMLDACPTKSTN